MKDNLSGKATLVAAIALLSAPALSFAQEPKPTQDVKTAQVVKPTPDAKQTQNDGFDKVEADGASLVAPVKSFKALSTDKSFRGTLSRWSKDMGWHLSWELDSEYAFDFEATFDGDFLRAVDGVCANLNSSGVPARAIAYEGNKVIRIVAEGAKR